MMQQCHRATSTETNARRAMRLCWPMRAAQGFAAIDVQTASTEFSPRRQRGLIVHHRMHAVHAAGGIGNAAGIRLEDRRGPFGRNVPELNTESPLAWGGTQWPKQPQSGWRGADVLSPGSNGTRPRDGRRCALKHSLATKTPASVKAAVGSNQTSMRSSAFTSSLTKATSGYSGTHRTSPRTASPASQARISVRCRAISTSAAYGIETEHFCDTVMAQEAPGGVVPNLETSIVRGTAWAKSKDFLVWARIFCARPGFSVPLAAADNAEIQQMRAFPRGGCHERGHYFAGRSLRTGRRQLCSLWCADRANQATRSASPILQQGLRFGCSRRATQGLAPAAASSRNVPHLQRTCAAAKRAGAGIAFLLCRVPNRRHCGPCCAAALRSPQSLASTRAERPYRWGAL